MNEIVPIAEGCDLTETAAKQLSEGCKQFLYLYFESPSNWINAGVITGHSRTYEYIRLNNKWFKTRDVCFLEILE